MQTPLQRNGDSTSIESSFSFKAKVSHFKAAAFISGPKTDEKGGSLYISVYSTLNCVLFFMSVSVVCTRWTKVTHILGSRFQHDMKIFGKNVYLSQQEQCTYQNECTSQLL